MRKILLLVIFFLITPKLLAQIPVFSFRFDSSGNLLTNCISGCSATAGFTDNSIFTVGSTVINPIGAYYSTSTPAISSGNAGRLRMDSSSYLLVDCTVGCSGSSFSDNSAFTAGTTAIGITGGWYSTSPTNCTSGDACAPQLTIDRKLFVQAFQGTSPWSVSGTVTANQGGAPWSVSASGNFGVTQQTSPWVVSANGGSFAVTGTFFQSTQPVSCANAATCPVTDTQGTSPWVDNISQVGGASLSLGQQVAAASLPVVLTAAQLSALTPLSTVTVTQSSGVNLHVDIDNFPPTQPITGTVKIVNTNFSPVPVFNQAPQQVYALVNGVLVPVLLTEGQTTMANSLPVTVASNQTAVPVSASQPVPVGSTVSSGATAPLAIDNAGVLFTQPAYGLPRLPCNSVRTTNCQHF